MFLFFVIISASAFNFLESSAPGALWTAPLTVYYNPTGCSSRLEGAISNALALWNGVATSNMKLQLSSEAVSTTALELYNNQATQVPLIACDTAFGVNYTSLNKDTTVGYGFYSRVGAEMVYGGVVINADATGQANHSLLNGEELTMLVAHELGHVLGLGHAASNYCMMYYSLGEKQSARLAQDDEDAITYLYPREELGSSGILGCGRVRGHTQDLNSQPRNGSLPGLLFILFPLLILAFFRMTGLAKVKT